MLMAEFHPSDLGVRGLNYHLAEGKFQSTPGDSNILPRVFESAFMY